MNTSDVRLFAMFAGWGCALYGVYRRDWVGTITAIAGLSVAAGALALGKEERLTRIL
jgi:hypothetical protein